MKRKGESWFFKWNEKTRARGTGQSGDADSLWFQFNEEIGTEGKTGNHPQWGIGNWVNATPANELAWSSDDSLDEVVTIVFAAGGRQKLRIQGRQATPESPCLLDQIWLSTTQKEVPIDQAPVEKTASQAVVEPQKGLIITWGGIKAAR